MKSKLFSIPLLIVLLLVSCLVFGGCSSSAPTSDSASTPKESQSPTNGPTAENPIVLKFASWLPMKMPPPIEWDPYDFMFNRWCDTIEEETDGKVVFERYPGESLVKMPDYWDAITEGTIDVGTIHPSTDPGKFKMTNALALPNLFPDSTVAAMTLTKLYEEGYTAPEWEGVHVIYWGINFPFKLANRVRPVETLEDWKGLKVGVEGEPETSTIKALGAIPVSMPVTEQYIALERGTIDAAVLCFQGLVAFKFHEVAQYITDAHGGARPVVLAMNQKTYNNLPADIKEVFDRNSGMLWAALHGARFDANTARAEKFLVKYQEEHNRPPIYYTPDEEIAKWMKVWEPVYEETISKLEDQGQPAEKMIDRAKELSQRYASWKLGILGSK